MTRDGRVGDGLLTVSSIFPSPIIVPQDNGKTDEQDDTRRTGVRWTTRGRVVTDLKVKVFMHLLDCS